MYDAVEMVRAFAGPVNAWAAAVRTFWSLPGFAGTPVGRAVAAAGEILERATRRYPKQPFAVDAATIDGRNVAVRETVLLRTPFCDLVRFERATERTDPKVLLIAPLSGHHASLLRGAVAALVADHDVYVTDWVDARLVPVSAGRFDLDDYIDLVSRFIRVVGGGCHVVSVSQPAVAALAAVSLMAEDGDAAAPRTLSLMGGPVDTRMSPTAPDRLAQSHPLAWFETAMIQRVPAGEPGYRRRVYPGFVQLSAFLALNCDRHAGAHARLWRDVVAGDEEGAAAHRRFYDTYLAVMDTPAEFYLQTIASVFQRHDLARGQMLHRGGRRVRPDAIRDTALMTVEAELDDTVGLGQTFAAHALCSGIPAERRLHHLQPGVGHEGLFSEALWRDELGPRLRDFIRRATLGA